MVAELNTKLWCNCILSGKHHKQDGFTLDRPSGLWVCSRCKKPSKMNYDRSVLGLTHVPQSADIYEHERKLDALRVARLEIADELDWDDEDEDDDN